MHSLNKLELAGNLGKDPELRYTPNGKAVCQFTIATKYEFQKNDGTTQELTEWTDVVVWGKLGEVCSKVLKKGNGAFVIGRKSTESWEKEGQKHYRTKCVAEYVTVDVFALSSKEPTEPQNSFFNDSKVNPEEDLPF